MPTAANRAYNFHMKRREYTYIWELENWPCWQYDLGALVGLLGRVSMAQGLLIGRLADVGSQLRSEASLTALTDDVVKSSEIEGDSLNVQSVRSSIARRLGVDIGALAPVDRHVDGVVDMVLDATGNAESEVTPERLFGWHASLFPTGYSGMSKIKVGPWRDDEEDGPMQVVSGPFGRQRVHYQAPPADRLDHEMAHFLEWLNHNGDHSPLIKAGLGHLWFVTLHPFDDGNGRIARAVGDLLLARADGSPQRFYSLSAQIQRDWRDYYDILEATQKSGMDVTIWLGWFLGTLERAIKDAGRTLDAVLVKARFWQRLGGISMNERQTKMLNKLLDGFEGNLTAQKWGKIAKCSSGTALRDINELIDMGVLVKSEAGGRSTSYELNLE